MEYDAIFFCTHTNAVWKGNNGNEEYAAGVVYRVVESC